MGHLDDIVARTKKARAIDDLLIGAMGAAVSGSSVYPKAPPRHRTATVIVIAAAALLVNHFAL